MALVAGVHAGLKRQRANCLVAGPGLVRQAVPSNLTISWHIRQHSQKAKYDEAIKKASAMDKPGPGADKKAVAG